MVHINYSPQKHISHVEWLLSKAAEDFWGKISKTTYFAELHKPCSRAETYLSRMFAFMYISNTLFSNLVSKRWAENWNRGWDEFRRSNYNGEVLQGGTNSQGWLKKSARESEQMLLSHLRVKWGTGRCERSPSETLPAIKWQPHLFEIAAITLGSLSRELPIKSIKQPPILWPLPRNSSTHTRTQNTKPPS